MSRHKEDDYIEEIKEWQEKQYVPGYYTGGKMSPGFKRIFRNKVVSITLLVLILLGIAVPFIKEMMSLFSH